MTVLSRNVTVLSGNVTVRWRKGIKRQSVPVKASPVQQTQAMQQARTTGQQNIKHRDVCSTQLLLLLTACTIKVSVT